MPLRIMSETVRHHGWLTLIEARLEGPDGQAFSREIEHHGDAVAVLPYDPERRTALLVAAPRAPVIRAGGPAALLEAPAGMLEAGEPAADCARREALEEAGVRLAELELVAEAFSTPGVSTEKIALFLAAYAAADRSGAGGGLAEEHEHLAVVEIPLRELWAKVEAGQLADLKTLALTLALKIRRPELFPPPPPR